MNCYIHRLACSIVLFSSLHAFSCALEPYKKEDQKQKRYLNDEVRLNQEYFGWKYYQQPSKHREVKPIRATQEEEIVRKMFVDTPNKEIVANLRKDKIDGQGAVLEIIRRFARGRKFAGWSANGYYSREAIDLKLIGLCRRVKFELFAEAKPFISPKFFYLYDWIRKNCDRLSLQQIANEHATTVLDNYPIRAIVRAIERHPAKKDKTVGNMVSAVFAQVRSRRALAKMYDKKMRIICQLTNFIWRKNPYNFYHDRYSEGYFPPLHALAMSAAIKETGASHPQQLKRLAIDTYSCLSEHPIHSAKASLVIEQCLLEGSVPELYMYDNKSFFKRTMLGDYIYFQHQNLENRDVFLKILNRPSNEQFEEIWDNLRGALSFQHALYKMSVPHLCGDDKRLKVVHDAALEIQTRIKSWAAALQIDLNNYPTKDLFKIYSHIVHAALAKDASDGNQTQELLLHIFRVAHCLQESKNATENQNDDGYCEGGNFGKLLHRLAELGAKPITLVCPDNPSDNRSLLLAYMIANWSTPRLEYSNQAWNLLSENERVLEMERWVQSTVFAQWFVRHRALRESKVLADAERFDFIASIMRVGNNIETMRANLLERLLA